MLLLSTDELFNSLLIPVFLPEDIIVRTGAIVAPFEPYSATPGVLFEVEFLLYSRAVIPVSDYPIPVL